LDELLHGILSENHKAPRKKESATTKKDRVTHCLTICENIVAQSLRNSPEFQKLLGIAMEMFLLCCDDAESDVRMVADECLNKIIKALTDSNLPRLQLELYKEIKKNGPSRSLRAALWRFAELAHLVRPQKCRPYLVNLLPCLARISKRSEESVQETLAAAVPKIMMALGNFANDSEIKMLLKTFIGNLKSSSPTIRRTAASSAVSICQHSRKAQYFYTWLLNVLLGFMVPVEEDRHTPLILGVMLTLRYLMPLLRQQVKDTSLRGSFGVTRKEAEISPSLEQLIQAYELTLHYTQHRDHNVVTAALEMLQQLFRTPPPELLRALTTSSSITRVSIARDDSSNRVRSGSIVELIGKMVSGEEDGLEDDAETRSEVSTATFPGSVNSEGAVDVPSPSALGSTSPVPDSTGHDIITQQPRSQHTLQSAESVDLNSSATSDLTGLTVEGDVDEALSRSSSQISTIQSDTNADQNDRTNQAISPLSESSQTTEGPDSAVTPSDSSELVLDGTDSQYSAMQIGQLQDEEEDTSNTPGDALLDGFTTSTLAVNKSHLLSHMGHSRQSSDSSVDRFVAKDDCVEAADLDTKQPCRIKGDIGHYTDENAAPLIHCVRLLSASFLLTGQKNGLIPDREVRVSVKALAVSCVGTAIGLHPEAFFNKLYRTPLEVLESQGYGVSLDNCVPLLQKTLKDKSSVTCKLACAAVRHCIMSLCNSSYSELGLQLTIDLLTLKNNSYWLVRTELLETLAEMDFRLVGFLERKTVELHRGQHHYTGMLKLQERAVNDVIIHLLGDEDPRVRHVAATTLVRLIPRLFFDCDQGQSDPVVAVARDQSSAYLQLLMHETQSPSHFAVSTITRTYRGFNISQNTTDVTIENNLSRVISAVSHALTSSTSRALILGCCEVLSLLSLNYPVCNWSIGWHCGYTTSSSQASRVHLYKNRGRSFSLSQNSPTDDSRKSCTVGMVNMILSLLSSAWFPLDLSSHQDALILSGNLLAAIAPKSLKNPWANEDDAAPTTKLEEPWPALADRTLVGMVEQLFSHLMKVINICAHVIDDVAPGPALKATLPSLANTPSLSPIRRKGKERESAEQMAAPMSPKKSSESSPGGKRCFNSPGLGSDCYFESGKRKNLHLYSTFHNVRKSHSPLQPIECFLKKCSHTCHVGKGSSQAVHS
ncbi:hypothetical protein scyTo_0015670, partial [Scyliorhinus torazame]|nr:hypothetical protein [Scyliorhinus torazame]